MYVFNREQNLFKSNRLKSLEIKEYKKTSDWNDYDIMKARWKYVRPQIRQLFHEHDMIVPKKSDDTFVTYADHGRLQGNFFDTSQVNELLNFTKS
jgi:hypothetical protein